MKPGPVPSSLRVLAAASLLFLSVAGAGAEDGDARAAPAADLRARYAALKDHLGHTVFRRPLQMESKENADTVSGEIHAVVDHPFALTDSALNTPSQWCDILMLHTNTKYCRVAEDANGTVLRVVIGTKNFQSMGEGFRVNLGYRVAARTADYLQVDLEAGEGPLGTRDVRIVAALMPADEGKTFIRFTYSYVYGTVARLAMQTYLGTLGRDKVGFTVVGREPGGGPRFIGGMRGLVERNTMRYYLALEAFLGGLSAPPGTRMAKALSDWFTATENYPRQLHELDRTEYLELKRKEFARRQS